MFITKLFRNINDLTIDLAPGVRAFFISGLLTIWFRLLYRLGNYFASMWLAVYLFIIENERIKKMPFYKKIIYVFTWPIFDIIGRYTMYVALFKKVEWKPIPHESKVTIDELTKGS